MCRLRVGTPRTRVTPVYFGVMLNRHHSCAPHLVYSLLFVSRFSHFSLNRVSEIFCAPGSLWVLTPLEGFYITKRSLVGSARDPLYRISPRVHWALNKA